MRQEFGFRVNCHAGQIGTDGLAEFSVLVTVRAVLLEHLASGIHIAGFRRDMHERLQHLVAIRVRQAAAHGEHFLGLSSNASVGECSQSLLLIERKIGNFDVAIFESTKQRLHPVRPTQHCRNR